MPIDEIKKVCFVGAGNVACFNSIVSAIAGYDVFLYDISEEALANSEARQRAYGEALIKRGFTTPEALEKGLARVTRTTDAAKAAENADLLSESVLERLELKRNVHAQFEKLLPSHAIMTTNTSNLSLSEIESAVENGDRFAAMHFHQPYILVDLVAGPRTAPRTIDILKQFVRSQNQLEIVLEKEKPGYIHNTLTFALFTTALVLQHIGAGSFQEIDRAWILNQAAYGETDSVFEEGDVGPFGLMDYIGINVFMDSIEGVLNKADLGELVMPEQKRKVAEGISASLRAYIERGDLGVKSGKGFYTYPNAEFFQPGFLNGYVENKDLSDALLNAVLKEAILLVVDGICDMEDVDRSWMVVHSPSIGPLGIIDQRGISHVSRQLQEQAEFIEALFGADDPDIPEIKRAVAYVEKKIQEGCSGVNSGKGFYEYPNPAFSEKGFLAW